MSSSRGVACSRVLHQPSSLHRRPSRLANKAALTLHTRSQAAASRNAATAGASSASAKQAAANTTDARQVTAQDTFNAVVANMPTSGTGALLGHGGRWERWQPPAAATAAAAAASKDQQPSKSSSSNNQQWQLLSSGQSMYAFQPGQDPSRGITVHVMEAADAAPVLMTDCTTDCTTAADVQGGGGGSSSSSADVMCSTNQFNVGDVWFLPHLPEADTNSGLGLLRLWAGNEHGFAMAPVRLPQQLLAAGGATDAADAAAAPWIANLYVKHPSLKPGVGRRWGWNVQYAPAQPQSTTTPATYPTAQSSSSSSSSSSSGWGLQHIHHTSLGMLLVDDVQEDMQPGGPQTLPPANNIKPPNGGIDGFMAQHPRLAGTALHFAYDSSSGQLTRRDISSCSWTTGSAAAGSSNSSSSSRESWRMLERWYSSGGYTKVPASLQGPLAVGQPLVMEAGAIIPGAAEDLTGQESSSSSSSSNRPAAVVRWLLSYSTADGLLQSARLERYQL